MEQSTRFKQVPNPTGVKCSRKFHGWICPGEALEQREEELFSRKCLERENKGRMKGQQAGVRLVQQHQGRKLNSGVETAKERRMEHSQTTGRGKQHFEQTGLITEMVNGRGSSKRKKSLILQEQCCHIHWGSAKRQIVTSPITLNPALTQTQSALKPYKYKWYHHINKVYFSVFKKNII